MKKSDKTPKQTHRRADPNVMGLHADVVEQNITETLETNYMPYAMSVIVSRAIPEIDGFKPSHRKLLYTMYKMGLLTGARTKSANIVGQTMRLNPHGDAAIYDTMVRLSKGYGALLHPTRRATSARSIRATWRGRPADTPRRSSRPSAPNSSATSTLIPLILSTTTITR